MKQTGIQKTSDLTHASMRALVNSDQDLRLFDKLNSGYANHETAYIYIWNVASLIYLRYSRETIPIISEITER